MKVNCLRRLVRFSAVLMLGAFAYSAVAQETTVKGKITDAFTGDPIPFVNVVYKGTSIGTTTDFEGNYSLTTSTPTDSLVASYIGYRARAKAVVKRTTQTINFQLEEDVMRLREVVVLAGENPAFAILRNVVKNKNSNDKRKLTAYEYDTYSKTEIDIDNITNKFREKKIITKITQVLDSIEQIAGEDGKPVLPIFISESVSKYYYRSNPELKFENIKETKISGVGFEDGSLMSQLIGASFQEYNFYKNWLNILEKDFVSPIADGWRLYYEYDLMDSLYIGDDYCYKLDFFPKSPQSLAFTGTMWITKEDYAIKQIEASVGKEANLNFIEKIRIQQELMRTSAGAWIPSKNRVLVDIGEINDSMAGILAKFYTSNRNIIVDRPKEVKFYSRPILLDEQYILNQHDEEHWNKLRHDPLTETESNVYRMIDTLQNIPVVRTYMDIIKILINGYKPVGKVDIGPYLSLLSLNNIEGLRVQSGFKTNYNFSKKWVLGGQLGYGFKDERFKYSASIKYILDRKHWTTMSLRIRSDLGRVGIDDENLADDYLLLAATRFGNFRRGYYFDETRLNFQRELVKGFSQRVAFRYSTFNPEFDFGYYSNPGDVSSLKQQFQTSEVIFESRFARDELFLQYDNERVSLGPQKWPIITFRYTLGLEGIGGSDFTYDKFRLSVLKRFPMGALGTGRVTLTGEYISGILPYPLLSMHIGNETPLYTDVIYSLMNFGEFFSDRFVSMQYRQNFEGFLLNSIPVMRKLKWRLTGLANVIYGDVSEKNLVVSDPLPFPETNKNLSYDTPYIELGYGVENIFRFFRIDFVHRLTYLENDRARKFGVLFTAQFKL